MLADQSLLLYFSQAGWVIKIVMLILILASILSWTFIIQRFLTLRQVNQATDQFIKRFWAGVDLSTLYSESSVDPSQARGIAVLFRAGFKELKRSQKYGEASLKDNIQRALTVAVAEELEELGKHLPFLASVGSVSPYIGLFGTVCGIMTVLQAMGTTQQAGISAIAPGISEALLATAMGLLAAIPAYLAYNRFVAELTRIEQQFANFTIQLEPLLIRQGN